MLYFIMLFVILSLIMVAYVYIEVKADQFYDSSNNDKRLHDIYMRYMNDSLNRADFTSGSAKR